jgi:hypothetical protein
MKRFANLGSAEYPAWTLVVVLGGVPLLPMFVVVELDSGDRLIVHRSLISLKP